MMDRHRGDRDRDRDRDYRDRDRDRDYRDRDRNRNFHHRRPSRFSNGPPLDNRRSPSSFRVRSIDSPPRDSGNFHPPPGDGGAFHPPMGGPPGGFWPMGPDVGGGFGNDYMGPPRPMLPPQSQPPPQQQPQPQPPSLSGQKRGFPFSARGSSPDTFDGKSFVKLFVGSVPRTVTEDEIRPLFEEQGKVLEIALIKDKRTGQQQGCCFIKYATSEEADRAIRALHNQYTLPGGVAPVQVRYADGERERLGNGAAEHKLFVGSLNKLAPEKEVEEIFAPYGCIEDVYLMRDERKQSRGCGFVKFSNKDSALAAIHSLNGIYTMRGCEQPLIVRFADPKRPRAGEPRPVSGPNFPGPMGGRGPPNAWQPISPPNRGPPPSVGVQGFGNQFPPRSGEAAISVTPGSHLGPRGNLTEGSGGGAVSATSTSPQNFNQPYPQVPPSAQQISPLQKPFESPQHFPPPLQLYQGPGMYSQLPTSQAPTSQASVRPPLSSQAGGQAPYNQSFPSQQLHGSTGQMPPGQFYAQQSATTASGLQHRPNGASSMTNPQLPTSASQQPPPYQQSPSQLTQMLSQQTQNLQASFQSSQLAISQLQQQVHMMQPSIQNQPQQQNFQASRQQPQWISAVSTTGANAPPLAPPAEAPSTSSSPAGNAAAAARPTPGKCSWTEHTSPDGHKYYYNSVTGESRWLKPEELALFEQQQQKLATQPPPNQPSLQAVPNQQATQSQPPTQLQTQLRHTEQLQNMPFPSMYQAPRGMGNLTAQEATYPQFQAPPNDPVNDFARCQQGVQPAHDWAWKNNSGGT